ncbi:hypothetical protein [Nocardia aurantiaca]|uniref:Uncharacterized protein n=1 Tax=Nocardia aurantiaca TaxID=2675850 RepID=A0A6I3KXI9_9NOCA|nr:hypothetical protein [Nocardia aurantiaca]MTE12804.1 hypothetical protein [Nocardia aurantiaca]
MSSVAGFQIAPAGSRSDQQAAHAVSAERTLSPGKPVAERWQIVGLVVPLGLIAVPVLVDRVAGSLTASRSAPGNPRPDYGELTRRPSPPRTEATRGNALICRVLR